MILNTICFNFCLISINRSFIFVFVLIIVIRRFRKGIYRVFKLLFLGLSFMIVVGRFPFDTSVNCTFCCPDFVICVCIRDLLRSIWKYV